MAGNTVSLTQSIDDREVVKAFTKQNQLLDKMHRKLDQVGRSGRKAGRDTADGAMGASRAIGGMAKSAVTAIASLSTFGTAFAAIRNEMEALEKRQKFALASQVGAAEAIRGARVNFKPDHTIRTGEEFEAEILKVAKQTRQPVPMVAAAMGDVLSAKGSLTNRQAFESFVQASRLRPGDEASSTTLAARAMDLSKVSGTEDPRQILGLLANIQASSRVTSLDKLGSTAVPAMAALAARGDTLEQSGELYATLTNLMADEEGRLAGTALKNLGTRLGTFVPEARGEDKRGKFTVSQEQMEMFAAAGSTTARIGALQQSPELRRQFLGQTSFDAASQAFIEQLLGADPKAMAALNVARRDIKPLGPGQAKLFEETVGGLEGGRFQGVLTAQQQAAANIEGFRLDQGPEARFAAVRKIVDETTSDIDFKGLDFVARAAIRHSIGKRVADLGETPEAAAATALQRVSKDESQRFFGDQGPDPEVRKLLAKQVELLMKLNESRNNAQPVEVMRDRRQVPRKPAAANLNRAP